MANPVSSIETKFEILQLACKVSKNFPQGLPKCLLNNLFSIKIRSFKTGYKQIHESMRSHLVLLLKNLFFCYHKIN